ncbi:flagellar assembly protein FliW [Rossellomorea marisflavi]|uniref:flagellar assembly protein FliW n=1 Tax=Rossellomorea marisflavi TaxID=189381 RepID=UPI00345AE301
MRITTKYHGEVDINPEQILLFPKGIPAFEEETQYTLLPFPNNDWFQILQSTNNPQLGFVTISPFVFFNDYDFLLDDASMEQLGYPSEGSIEILSILTVRDPFEDSTLNLQAPLVINRNEKIGKQLILNDTHYRIRHKISAN